MKGAVAREQLSVSRPDVHDVAGRSGERAFSFRHSTLSGL
jgi:hypothetical protein